MSKKAKVSKGHIIGLLKKQGIENDMKANMRSKILDKLQGTHLQSPSVDFRITCSLIENFLKFHCFKYTLSVFEPECGDSSALLSNIELAEYFSIDFPQSISMLEQLLSNLTPQKTSKKDSSSQTLETSSVSNLESQLLALDMKFAEKRVESNPLFEEKIMKVQRECENRMKLELEQTVKRIREIEIVNMKLEESSKYQEMLKRYKDESERNYFRELEGLKNREKKIVEQNKARENELENKAFAQRQEMLLNMEKNQKMIQELRRKIQLEEAEVENLKETWKERVKDCEYRVEKLSVLEKETELKAKEDFLRYKTEFESRFEDEKRKLTLEKVEIEGIKKSFDLDSDRARSALDQLEHCGFEIEKLRTENKVLKEQNKDQAQAVEQLRAELRLIADTQNHLIGQLNIKESSLKVLESELDSYKTLAAELKDSLHNLKISSEKEKLKLQREVEGFKKSNVMHDYLAEKKYHWEKIQKEENDIRQEFFEVLKPSPKSFSPAKTVPKTQANVKNFANYEYDSSSSNA